MTDQFLHGVEVIQVNDGTRPIRTVRTSVIGLIGTAPEADPAKFPINKPVLIAGRRGDAAGLGDSGTLGPAIDAIFDQIGATIVLIRVEEGADRPETMANIIGGIDNATGFDEGMQAFLSAKAMLGVAPRLLIAPEFTNELSVASEMLAIANRLRAYIIVEGPNSNDADALAYRKQLGSHRYYMVDPAVTFFDTKAKPPTNKVQSNSARVAGVIAKTDSEEGYWVSPSNKVISGITGTARPIDFTHGDRNSRANLLNEKEVATIIQENGFRLWGNRTCSDDPRLAFLNVARTSDVIADSIQAAHLWAVDRNIKRTFLEDVVDSVNGYIRDLAARDVIINGRAWADPELNSPANIRAGKSFINYEFSASYPNEHMTFRAHLVDDYLTEVLPIAA